MNGTQDKTSRHCGGNKNKKADQLKTYKNVLENKLHADGSICLEGIKRVPRNFKPCCDFFKLHTTSCAYDIRFEWWSKKKIWVIPISDEAGGGGINILFCPHCGKKL
jgi:hypothetical protein